jgi:transcription termination factor Rho
LKWEFKETGNAEIVLNKKLAEQRIWPAIDLNELGVRLEENISCSKNFAQLCISAASIWQDAQRRSNGKHFSAHETCTNAEFLSKLKGI